MENPLWEMGEVCRRKSSKLYPTELRFVHHLRIDGRAISCELRNSGNIPGVLVTRPATSQCYWLGSEKSDRSFTEKILVKQRRKDRKNYVLRSTYKIRRLTVSPTCMMLVDPDPKEVFSQARGLPYAVIWAPPVWICKLIDSDTTLEELEELRENASRLERIAKSGRTRARNLGHAIPWTINGTSFRIGSRATMRDVLNSYRKACIKEIMESLEKEE